MLCRCKPRMVVPVKESVAQAYWGYIHAVDKRWKIKRWIPVNPYISKCDRCLAEEDYVLQKQNDTILCVGAWPVYACNAEHAAGILAGLQAGAIDERTWFEHQTSNRFVDLLDELYNT